ncbi:uncharacterized protein [Pyrus communis]|uniref:uncharacterized protein n=1 Tax=Pyrus communis TaxID=23211 RepID=UPI0035BEE4EF
MDPKSRCDKATTKYGFLGDYFVCNSAFPNTYFRRRFRMERHLFNKIMIDVCKHDSYFMQKKDTFGVIGLLPEQKITAALRMLAYRASANQVDEIARMGKSTILESLMRFCSAIESIYTTEYLWRPTKMDLQRLLKKGEMRGFFGMIRSQCTGPGKNVQVHGKELMATENEQKVSFRRRWHHLIHGFGTLFSVL